MNSQMADTPPKPVNIRRLLGRAFVWALATGVGVFLVLFFLAQWMGETEKSYQFAFLFAPIVFGLMFLGVLFFQLPRAMALKKGAFAVYLTFLTIPVLALGGAILWWFFR